MSNFSNRNQKITAWILVIVAVYYFLQFKDFSWDLKIMLFPLVKFAVFITGFISVFFLKVKWFVKTITSLFYLILIAISYEVGLVKLSMVNYFNEKEPDFEKIVKIVQQYPEPNWLYLDGKNVVDRVSKYNINEISENELAKFFNKSDVLEIMTEDKNILFVFSRFIDNGYGFMYVEKPNSILVKQIHSMQIISSSPLKGHWYFVSFT